MLRLRSGGIRRVLVPIGVFLVCSLLILAHPNSVSGQPATSEGQATLPDSVLVQSLRNGGHLLACRHAMTDWSFVEEGPQAIEQRSTQRNLSSEGIAQARDIGREVDRLRLPVGPVLSSPWLRNFDSAELSFGNAEVDESLHDLKPEKEAAFLALFSDPTEPGRNRVLMTHQTLLRHAMPRFERGEIDEGHCIVVRPQGNGSFVILAHLAPDDWRRLR